MQVGLCDGHGVRWTAEDTAAGLKFDGVGGGNAERDGEGDKGGEVRFEVFGVLVFWRFPEIRLVLQRRRGTLRSDAGE